MVAFNAGQSPGGEKKKKVDTALTRDKRRCPRPQKDGTGQWPTRIKRMDVDVVAGTEDVDQITGIFLTKENRKIGCGDGGAEDDRPCGPSSPTSRYRAPLLAFKLGTS
jgi:hypothetical protein